MRNNPDLAAQEIFHAALEYDLAGRDRFLARACGCDTGLRREVESLLASFEQAGDFLESSPIHDLHDRLLDHSPTTGLGDLIGRYRIVEVLSTGGMGEVYRAVRADGAFDQQVAVKLIRSDALSSESKRRFTQERQTLARLEHPCITRLIDGGSTPEGRPYLVIEYVEGLPIDRFCSTRRLSIRERLDLFRKVCDAVHFAHRNLIVHRDIKPANILVTPDGTPKVLDFGIAKLLDEVAAKGDRNVTTTAYRAMTPRYASPEQIKGRPITTATDIYSLGVLLYELLTGSHPHPLENYTEWECARLICESDPPPPSQALVRRGGADPARHRGRASRHPVARVLRGDLDNIVLMAMQKDPRRRYGSAEQFAEDIERYLLGAPVIARRDTFAYRTSKWVRRNKALAAISVSLLVALMLGVAGTSVGMLRAKSARDRAESQRLAALQAQSEAEAVTRFLQETLAAANPYRQGRELGVAELLEQATKRIESELAQSPSIEASVRYAIASTYAGMWDWNRVIPQVQTALDLNRRLYGDQSPRVADCLSLLGRALTFNRDPKCVQLQNEGLRIRRELFGDNHPAVAESLGNLGFAEWHGRRKSDWTSAERHYRESLAMYESLGIEVDPDVARFTYSLGVMLSNRGRLDEAEDLFKKALSIFDRLPVTQDCYRARCMGAYAATLEAMGKKTEAEEMRRQMREISPPGLEPLPH